MITRGEEHLPQIARSALLVFAGTIIGMLVGLIGRLIIARYVSQEEYGVYSLVIVIINIAVIVSLFGLDAGIARQVAYYRTKTDIIKTTSIIISALKIVAISSFCIAIIVFFTADIVANYLLMVPELVLPLRIACVCIPLLSFMTLFVAVFRGFGQVEPAVYFQNILRNALFPALLLIVINLNISFIGVFWAMVVSVAVTFICFVIYTVKRERLIGLIQKTTTSFRDEAKELLAFSLPLLSIMIIGTVISWTDILLLGYFKTATDVGLYNAALPLVNMLPLIVAAINFIFVPLVTQSFVLNRMAEIRANYAALSKWIYALTLPIFLILLLFPGMVVTILFGPSYATASIALQILACGYFISTILGLNGAVLLALGQTRFIMLSSLISAIINIVLNCILIPQFSIAGAALATTVALVLRNVMLSLRLYKIGKVNPFARNYLKPAIASIVLILMLYLFVKSVISVYDIWILPVLFVVFLIIYALSMLLTKSVDKADIMMLLTIEERLGMDLTSLKKVIKKLL